MSDDKVTLVKCGICSKKFPAGTLINGVCPSCMEKVKTMKHKSPELAFILSVLPGAGLAYIGQNNKAGAVIIGILLSIWIPILGWMLIPLIWAGSAMDAYISAGKINKIKESTI